MPAAMSKALYQDCEHVLEYARDALVALRGGRIFMTGGTGFIGTWMLETFAHANRRLNLGASVVVMSRDPERFARTAPHLACDTRITFHAGTLGQDALPPGPFSTIIHAAGAGYEGRNAPRGSTVVAADVAATQIVLEWAASRPTRRMLFTSSGAVYGVTPPDIDGVDESFTGAPSPTDSTSGYAHGKRISEYYCAAFAREKSLSVSIARLFTFVGPHLALDGPYAIGNFIADALAKRPITIIGDGTAIRSYLYGSDLAAWLWTILEFGHAGAAYNVGSSIGTSVRALAEILSRASSDELPIVIRGEPEPGADPNRYIPDVTRARTELGLQQRVTCEEAVLKTLAWHRIKRQL